MAQNCFSAWIQTLLSCSAVTSRQVHRSQVHFSPINMLPRVIFKCWEYIKLKCHDSVFSIDFVSCPSRWWNRIGNHILHKKSQEKKSFDISSLWSQDQVTWQPCFLCSTYWSSPTTISLQRRHMWESSSSSSIWKDYILRMDAGRFEKRDKALCLVAVGGGAAGTVCAHDLHLVPHPPASTPSVNGHRGNTSSNIHDNLTPSIPTELTCKENGYHHYGQNMPTNNTLIW